MARIRSVKPELRDSKLVASWPMEVRFFWVLFWGYLDDHGRGLDMPKRIAGDCFPHDDYTGKDVDEWLTLMGVGRNGDPGPICRYEVNGNAYVHAINWSEHQKPNRPTPSRIPPCPFHESITESLNGTSLPGAAEQGSRGAGEQQRAARESVTTGALSRSALAAAEIEIQANTDATDAEAGAVARLIFDRRKNVNNLPGLVRTLASAGDLKPFLDDVRAAAAVAERSRSLAAARDGPPCEHGMAGGNQPHPDSGEPRCVSCRMAARRLTEGAAA